MTRLLPAPLRTQIPAALLALWGTVLLFSGLSGRLDLLLHGAFHGLVAAAGLVLLLLAAVLLRANLQQRGAGSPPRLSIPWLLSALVAAAVLLLPPDPSFTVLASSRPEGLPDPPKLAFILPPEQRSLSEWVRLLRSRPDPALYNGQAVRISGFVLPRDGGPPVLARLLVRCCLAAATPIGLAVRWPTDRPLPKRDQWLQVEGVMAVQAGPQGEELVLVPRRIQPIPRPQRPLEP